MRRRHYYVGLHCETFLGAVQLLLLGSFSVDDGDGDANENVTFKEFMVFQILTRLFQFTFKNVKCRRISLELSSWGTQSSLKRDTKIGRRLFTSSIKRETRHFYAVVGRDGKEMFKKA